MKMFRHLALTAVLLLDAEGVYAQDWEKGLWSYIVGDYRKAFQELKPLAENNNARAQVYIGMMYSDGFGTPQNYSEAVKWFRRSAEQGNAEGQYHLGNMYSLGWGVPENDTEAVRWFRLGAHQENPIAQFNLGIMYAKGDGVSKDNVLAHMWFNLSSAVSGYEAAMSWKLKVEGEMTPEDISKAQAMAIECMNSGYANCGD